MSGTNHMVTVEMLVIGVGVVLAAQLLYQGQLSDMWKRWKVRRRYGSPLLKDGVLPPVQAFELAWRQ